MNNDDKSRYDPNHGGQDAVKRILEAYGFKTRTELSEHTGISTSTFGTWWRRDFYPAQVMVWCALETGVSLKWLATGDGPKFESAKDEASPLKKYQLDKGKLVEDGYIILDNALLSEDRKNLKLISSNGKKFIVNYSYEEITDGCWLVEIEGRVSIRDLELIPVGKVRVSSDELKAPFECALSDISVLGIVETVIAKI
uniref:phage repressor protein CI n=1 Tax=Hafnia alvei TaxID=569 RepID=UPI00242B0289|nr:phage repressor protein CI [Hafnia alvei]